MITQNINSAFLLPRKAALFLDFDGTLTPLQDDPGSVYLTSDQEQCLLDLTKALKGAVAVISGRGIADLDERLPRALWRIGNHGLEVLPPNQKPSPSKDRLPEALVNEVKNIAVRKRGVWFEEKGSILALHYRLAADYEPELIRKMTALVARFPKFQLMEGNRVIEITPLNANKGYRIRRQMRHPTFIRRTPIMIGDDRTDEDGFAMVQSLGGIGIKIGAKKTLANFRLSNRDDIYPLLQGLL